MVLQPDDPAIGADGLNPERASEPVVVQRAEA
jgi:hypothetical protein